MTSKKTTSGRTAKAAIEAAAKVTSKVASKTDAAQTFELTRQLPHLLRRAHFEAESKFGLLIGDHVTSRQLALLVSIARTPGMTQSAIAQTVGLDLNTLSDLVVRLCSKDLVRRERSASDGRAHSLFLTDAGRRVVADALPDTQVYARAVAHRLTLAQTEQLVDLLRELLGFGANPQPAEPAEPAEPAKPARPAKAYTPAARADPKAAPQRKPTRRA